jgi:hypothetical protein
MRTLSTESTEMKWLAENSRELECYRGEWLLIRGEALVAHDPDFHVLQRLISKQDLASPLVYYVPTEEESNFIAI